MRRLVHLEQRHVYKADGVRVQRVRRGVAAGGRRYATRVSSSELSPLCFTGSRPLVVVATDALTVAGMLDAGALANTCAGIGAAKADAGGGGGGGGVGGSFGGAGGGGGGGDTDNNGSRRAQPSVVSRPPGLCQPNSEPAVAAETAAAAPAAAASTIDEAHPAAATAVTALGTIAAVYQGLGHAERHCLAGPSVN